MRPNIDIPWSIHGKIKEYAEANDITIEEAYIETLNQGTEQLSIPNTSNSITLEDDQEWFPFGHRQIRTQGEESYEINDVVTCFPHIYQGKQPVRIETRRQNVSIEKFRSYLSSLQSTGYITQDWFTVHQLGGAWIGRGMKNFAQTMSKSQELFLQADFPMYKTGIVMYVASLPRKSEYLIVRAEMSRHSGGVSDLSLRFLTDGHPVSGRRYYEIASQFEFSELFNGRDTTLLSLGAHFEESPEINVTDVITKSDSNRDEPWVSGLMVENPLQQNPKLVNQLEWNRTTDSVSSEEAENTLDTLLNYDELYCELDHHHPVSDDHDYRLEGLTATYLSPLFDRNSIWNVSLGVDW